MEIKLNNVSASRSKSFMTAISTLVNAGYSIIVCPDNFSISLTNGPLSYIFLNSLDFVEVNIVDNKLCLFF